MLVVGPGAGTREGGGAGRLHNPEPACGGGGSNSELTSGWLLLSTYFNIYFQCFPAHRCPLSPLRKKTVTYRKKTVTYRKTVTSSGTDVPRPPEWPWKAKGDEVLQTIANLNQESSLQARIAGSFYPDQELLS